MTHGKMLKGRQMTCKIIYEENYFNHAVATDFGLPINLIEHFFTFCKVIKQTCFSRDILRTLSKIMIDNFCKKRWRLLGIQYIHKKRKDHKYTSDFCWLDANCQQLNFKFITNTSGWRYWPHSSFFTINFYLCSLII